MAHIGTVLKLLDLPTMDDVQRTAQAQAARDPEMQLREAMASHGIEPPDYITMDGKLHRFSTNGKHGDKSGWYVAYADEVPAGSFGCWRTIGEGAINWRADVGRTLSFDEERAFAARQAEAKRVREIENARAKAEGAARAKQEWESASVECSAHPYIAKKGLKSNPGWRLLPDGCLVSPMIQDGEIVGTQSIWIDGQKKFEYGSTLGGSWWHVGGPVWGVSGRVYVAEGVATAASIHEATGRPVVVSYSAGNLPAAAKALRAMSPEAEIVIVADVEAAKEGDGSIGACKAREADKDDGGIGARKAREAAQAVSGKVIVMPTWPGGPAKMDANDFACMGGDLRALLDGELDTAKPQEDEWLVSADDWSQQPMPIKWLVKHWLQEDALIMVHGPSGSGKTFVVLDWILRMASGGQQAAWGEKKVKPGTVVYLAGEGHQGLRGRIAGWKHSHGVGKLDMWLTRGGCDLNTPEGYSKVASAIKEKEVKPSIIVVDTLHRFLMGDENKAQDAKTMLDACAKLMAEFGCSVLLVHHTGVSEEAQHRARGSSAWRGALDIEISVTPSKDGNGPVEIAQRKSKDAELAKSVYANLKSVSVPGWFDEDGEQVTTAVLDVLENYVPANDSDQPASKPATAAEKALHEHKQTMREAWAKGGHDTRDGAPYLARSTLLAYLTEDCGKNQKTAENAIAPKGNMMRQLQQNGFCRPHEHGWIITDNDKPSDGGPSINIGALQANEASKKASQEIP